MLKKLTSEELTAAEENLMRCCTCETSKEAIYSIMDHISALQEQIKELENATGAMEKIIEHRETRHPLEILKLFV